jgi:hypothetical protein
MNKKLSLSKFRKNAYLQLFFIFGNQSQLNKYLDIFFKYHHLCRFKDIYLSHREELFHSNWIGMNNSLVDHLDHIYNQAMYNLRLSGQVEEQVNEWNQIAKYECELFLYDLNQMYQKNRDLEEFGFTIQKLINILFSNFDEGSHTHLSTLNKYMAHSIYGKVIRSKLSTINLDLWKVRCLDRFDDVVIEFIYALKVQYISAMNNTDKQQVIENVNCIRIYMSVLKYESQVSYRLVNLIQYLSQLPTDIWQNDCIVQSSKWIPAVKQIYHYQHSRDEAFSELFLNNNEDFYFKYPAQLLNYKVHPIQLVRMRCCLKMFKILNDYRNQILIFRVLNTYLYFMICCFAYLVKKVVRFPWIKISVYLIVFYFCIQAFKTQAFTLMQRSIRL